MWLQNVVMQLRKVYSHPFLFKWPIDPDTNKPVLGAELVNASGKMMVLDRLLRESWKRGHRVLIFNQFVTVLNIIEVSPTRGSSSPTSNLSDIIGLGDRLYGLGYLLY
jgi:ATP-dependent DNA helicase